MPKRKTVEPEVQASAEVKKARAAAKPETSAKPKAAAATHKRASKPAAVKEASMQAPNTEIFAAGTKSAEVPVEIIASSMQTATFVNEPPTREEIAKLAYSFWARRGYQDGDERQDWLRAERELGELSQNS